MPRGRRLKRSSHLILRRMHGRMNSQAIGRSALQTPTVLPSSLCCTESVALNLLSAATHSSHSRTARKESRRCSAQDRCTVGVADAALRKREAQFGLRLHMCREGSAARVQRTLLSLKIAFFFEVVVDADPAAQRSPARSALSISRPFSTKRWGCYAPADTSPCVCVSEPTSESSRPTFALGKCQDERTAVQQRWKPKRMSKGPAIFAHDFCACHMRTSSATSSQTANK